MIDLPFGASLASIAKLPKGSEHSLKDPFAVTRKRWKLLLALFVLLLAYSQQKFSGKWGLRVYGGIA